MEISGDCRRGPLRQAAQHGCRLHHLRQRVGTWCGDRYWWLSESDRQLSESPDELPEGRHSRRAEWRELTVPPFPRKHEQSGIIRPRCRFHLPKGGLDMRRAGVIRESPAQRSKLRPIHGCRLRNASLGYT